MCVCVCVSLSLSLFPSLSLALEKGVYTPLDVLLFFEEHFSQMYPDRYNTVLLIEYLFKTKKVQISY